jgi:hypothetical protein
LEGNGVVGVEDGTRLMGDPVGFRDVVGSVEMVGLDEGYTDGFNVGFIDGSPEGFVVEAFEGAGVGSDVPTEAMTGSLEV